MYDRSISPGHSRVLHRRRVLGQIHWRALIIPADRSLGRGAQISARVDEARERHFRQLYGRSGRCGL